MGTHWGDAVCTWVNKFRGRWTRVHVGGHTHRCTAAGEEHSASTRTATPPTPQSSSSSRAALTRRYYHPSTARRYEGLKDTGVRARLDLGRAGGVHEVGYHHQHSDGVDWVFVDHISYHREGTPYGNAHGTYGDNLFRWAGNGAVETPC